MSTTTQIDLIVRDVCEVDRPDYDGENTLVIDVTDLRLILERHLTRQPEVSEEDVTTAERVWRERAGTTGQRMRAALTAVWHNRPAQEKCSACDDTGRVESTDGGVWGSCYKCGKQAQEKAEPVAFIITDAKGKKFTIYNQLLAEAMRHIAKQKGSTLRVDAVCTIPDFGWFCTRGEGHEGPCAAWPNSPTETCPTCGGPATRHEVSGPFEMRDEYRTAPPAERVRVPENGGE